MMTKLVRTTNKTKQRTIRHRPIDQIECRILLPHNRHRKKAILPSSLAISSSGLI